MYQSYGLYVWLFLWAYAYPQLCKSPGLLAFYDWYMGASSLFLYSTFGPENSCCVWHISITVRLRTQWCCVDLVFCLMHSFSTLYLRVQIDLRKCLCPVRNDLYGTGIKYVGRCSASLLILSLGELSKSHPLVPSKYIHVSWECFCLIPIVDVLSKLTKSKRIVYVKLQFYVLISTNN